MIIKNLSLLGRLAGFLLLNLTYLSRKNKLNQNNQVVFHKDIYNTEYLQKLGLNERQIKAVLFVKDRKKITNSDYQVLNEISKRTATTELTELTNKFKVLTKVGASGAGIYYKLVGQ